ncbi:MAG: serine/threonine-protein kinase, partial [Myxococcota bacterium]
MQLSAGQQIRHYTLNYRLGQGGMAEVWAATNSILGVQVALKVLFGGNPILQQRLIREGRAQAALDHENILPVRDVIDVGGSLGLILPLIQGPSLDKLLQHYRPSTDETVALFRAIVEGVGHAHQHGLIHRDLKPGNILLEERWGRVVPRVADFGLVKGSGPSFSENEGVTRTNSMMGTLHYAAPEQLLDASTVDHRADLFSLGVILVEMLTGRRPFQASSLRELLAAYKTGPDLSGVPEAFQELCLSLLADDANHRLSDSAILTKQLGIVHRLPPRQVLGLVSGVAKAMREISIVHNAPNPSLIPSLSGGDDAQSPIASSKLRYRRGGGLH